MRIHALSKRVVSAFFAAVLSLTFIIAPKASADENYVGPLSGFQMSPMTERIELKPGDTYKGTFYIMNPERNTSDLRYKLEVKSFYRDENNEAVFEDVDGRGQLADWITLDCKDSGTLAPRESANVTFTINVPYNVPAGGQYAAIVATSIPPEGDGGADSATIRESVAMAHTVLAEVKGNTIRTSEINSVDVPGFIFDGNIKASAKVSNTGNIHGTATYTFEVYPLFSSDPVYTNEDEPEKKLILPDRSLLHETVWENTPTFGIFNVHYKVEFEGGNVKEVTKLVIKCPVWLLFILLLVIIAIVAYVVRYIKGRKGARKEFTREPEE